MPTDAEWTELCEQCTWTWTTQNGVNGYQVTSKTNSNSIFLPAAGCRGDTRLSHAGSVSYYWSASLYLYRYPYYAQSLYSSDHRHLSYGNRCDGFSVRPVCPSSTNILIAIAQCENVDTIRCDAGQQITITAVPANEHRHFVRWSDGNTDNPRTISVTKDSTFTAEFAQDPAAVSVYEDCSKSGKTYDFRPVQAVDLGLPSGLKWASCNIGATTPEEYGYYYAWGETTTKADYSWETYKYANGAKNKLTKYCTDASYGDNGFADNKTTLDLEDDAAHVKWGGSWRMPTGQSCAHNAHGRGQRKTE